MKKNIYCHNFFFIHSSAISESSAIEWSDNGTKGRRRHAGMQSIGQSSAASFMGKDTKILKLQFNFSFPQFSWIFFHQWQTKKVKNKKKITKKKFEGQKKLIFAIFQAERHRKIAGSHWRGTDIDSGTCRTTAIGRVSMLGGEQRWRSGDCWYATGCFV